MTDGPAVAEFVAVMRQLRAECAWKAEQTHRSLARYLLEETHETLDAIDTGQETGDWSHLREELGDVLLQVVFHAVIAEEQGRFDLEDVARDVTAKMRRRNPHVFGDIEGADLDPAAVNDLWERAKAAEQESTGEPSDEPTALLRGLPPGLPALLHADKVIDRLLRAGRDLEVASESADVGERLLALVAEARATGTDPEQALRDAVRRRL